MDMGQLPMVKPQVSTLRGWCAGSREKVKRGKAWNPAKDHSGTIATGISSWLFSCSFLDSLRLS